MWRPLEKLRRQGQSLQGQVHRAARAGREAEHLIDEAIEIETAWKQVCFTLEWFTLEGELNTPETARAKMDVWLPRLKGSIWSKTVRILKRPESLAFLDRIGKQLKALPIDAQDRRDAIRLEAFRRIPGLLTGEGNNSVVRMQQARHRRMTTGLIDLKRFYWNCRQFRTGLRKNHSPYELLGIRLPTDDWWELLQKGPDHLRQELSAQ